MASSPAGCWRFGALRLAAPAPLTLSLGLCLAGPLCLALLRAMSAMVLLLQLHCRCSRGGTELPVASPVSWASEQEDILLLKEATNKARVSAQQQDVSLLRRHTDGVRRHRHFAGQESCIITCLQFRAALHHCGHVWVC